MSKEAESRSLTENLLGLGQKLDKIAMVGGAVVAVAYSAAIGGLIIGGSLASHEIGRDWEKKAARQRLRNQKLGDLATR